MARQTCVNCLCEKLVAIPSVAYSRYALRDCRVVIFGCGDLGAKRTRGLARSWPIMKSAVRFSIRTALNGASTDPLFPNSGTEKTYGDFERLSLCRSACLHLA